MQQNFRDYRTHFRKQYTERSKDFNGTPLHFSDTVLFNFGRGLLMDDS